MKLGFRRDFAVQVRDQEHDEEEEWGAVFYRGIFSVTLNQLITILFIPSFPRTADTWPPTILEGVDQVQSETEARLYITESADYVVTPDPFLAGQQEVIPIPAIPPEQLAEMGLPFEIGPRQVVVFYVTDEQFARFSQELRLIEKQTYWVYDYVRVSKVNHFECIRFIQNYIIKSPYFSDDHLQTIGRQSETRHRREQPVLYGLNGTTKALSLPTLVESSIRAIATR
ncbi:MAG: hypothetical protein ACPGWR_11395 [Ardenticatenaceae bacterium]